MKLNKKQLFQFTQSFYSLNKAGITISNALYILEKENKNNKSINNGYQKVINKIRSDIEGGASLSTALGNAMKIPDFYRQMIDVGEKTGKLEETFFFLTKYLEKGNTLKKEIIAKLIYPLIVIVAVIITCIGFVIYLKPVYDNLILSMRGKEPLTTSIFIRLCNVIAGNYKLVLGIIFAIALLSKILKALVIPYKYFCDSLKFKIPFISKIFILMYESNICHIIFMLLSSGISLTESLYICSDNTDNLVLRKMLLNIYKSILSGESLEKSINEYKLPYKVKYLLSVGEITGELEDNFKKIEESSSFELNNLLKTIENAMEPSVTIILASIVLFIMIAILQPAYSVINNIK